MIVGLGIDVVDIKEFQVVVFNNLKVRDKIFTINENNNNNIQNLGGVFAAKEATIKATSGYLKLKMRDIEIIKSESGVPFVSINSEQVNLLSNLAFHVSISHSKNTVVAVVILER